MRTRSLAILQASVSTFDLIQAFALALPGASSLAANASQKAMETHLALLAGWLKQVTEASVRASESLLGAIVQHKALEVFRHARKTSWRPARRTC